VPYQEDLDKLRGQKRVWILFSHIWRTGGVDEEVLFLNYLDMIGSRLDSIQATGASAYLYDLSIRGPFRSSSAARPENLGPGIGDSVPSRKRNLVQVQDRDAGIVGRGISKSPRRFDRKTLVSSASV